VLLLAVEQGRAPGGAAGARADYSEPDELFVELESFELDPEEPDPEDPDPEESDFDESDFDDELSEDPSDDEPAAPDFFLP
jgi:hypothetical protein